MEDSYEILRNLDLEIRKYFLGPGLEDDLLEFIDFYNTKKDNPKVRE